jgi:protein-S-isoprenylcysteine O-methyltransferase Ste14
MLMFILNFLAQFLGNSPDWPIYYALIIIWLLLAVYWAGSGIYDIATGRAKPKLKGGGSWLHEIVPRLLIAADVIAFVVLGDRSVLTSRLVPGPNLISYTGIAISLVGVLFAIWARRYLGGNWGTTVMLKKKQTLIRNGPYAIVRHPIYTGIALGFVGTAIALGNAFGIILLLGILLFVFLRMQDEEKLMVETFGKEYLQYEKEVKRFVPFIY